MAQDPAQSTDLQLLVIFCHFDIIKRWLQPINICISFNKFRSDPLLSLSIRNKKCWWTKRGHLDHLLFIVSCACCQSESDKPLGWIQKLAHTIYAARERASNNHWIKPMMDEHQIFKQSIQYKMYVKLAILQNKQIDYQNAFILWRSEHKPLLKCKQFYHTCDISQKFTWFKRQAAENTMALIHISILLPIGYYQRQCVFHIRIAVIINCNFKIERS